MRINSILIRKKNHQNVPEMYPIHKRKYRKEAKVFQSVTHIASVSL